MTCTDIRRTHSKVEHPARPKNRRIAIGVLVAVLLICVAIAVSLLLRQEAVEQPVDLEAVQNEFVQELQDNAGSYDTQSIVLAGTSEPVARALAEKLGAELRITKDGSYATLTLPEGVTILDVAMSEDYLADLPRMSADYEARISDIVPDEESDEGERLPMRPQYSVSDSDYDRQTYLDYLNMQNIWTYTQGSGITVAVIDTGIDTDHPEFAGRISEYSYNATEDKIVKDYILSDGSMDWSLVEDEQGHGTAVAGVIAAAMDNNGIVGIAPQVNIIVIKAECDATGKFKRTSDLVFGLYYAIERDVAVVNMSFGVEVPSDPFAEAAQLAFDSDVICVAAAGNNATANLTWPAAGENVFGVGALANNSWELAEYSNYGENVDLVAPGTVYTTKMGGGYGGMNGTSFASPITAGVLALYMSRNMYTEFNTVEELLYASCCDLGDLGPDFYYGYGVLDVSALMLEEQGTVTFNMMTDELENTEQVFIRSHTLQNMPEPERLYAIFDGWYYDPQCTDEYVWYEDEFYGDLTLYANWVNEDDGVPYIYVELDDGTIEIRSYTGHRRYITIPDFIDGKVVSSIGEEAFRGETRLREVKLPKYLQRIRRSAFEGCSNLVSIEIPDTVTEIGYKAFYDNVRLSTLVFGQESRLESIGNFAFSGCSKMRTFTVPSKVVTLNATAFYRNTSMLSFDVQNGNTAFIAKDGVLFNNTGSTLVCYPSGVKGTYTLPESTKSVGLYAFACTKLGGVELSNVETLGDCAFYLGSLESIVIPDSVTYMGDCVFSSNGYMRSAKLGRGLTNISDSAFSSTALTSIEIPAGIRSIGTGAFSDIGCLAEVTFAPGSTLTYIGGMAFFDSGVVEIEIPASVVTIDESAFAAGYFPCLTSLTFEQGSALYTIGYRAFSNQYRLCAVDLPDRLNSLGDFSFSGTGLLTVDIPASVAYFGEGAFASCHSLENIFVEDDNANYLDVDGVVYDTPKKVIVAYPAGNARTAYSILEGVTDVGVAAFYGSWNLTHVDMASTVITVRNSAFYDCEKVVSYQLNEGLTYIEQEAFSQNYSLQTMSMPDSLMQIGRYAFAKDWNLRSVTFTENAKLPRISFGAFAYCGLSSFRVPANVSTMAQRAFEGCSKLQSFTFAKNSKLESISAYMFDGCSNLRTITFEKGSALTSIQAHGLEGMRKLTTIDFGDAKLTNIDNFAFRFCESLTRFDIPEGVTFLGRYAFYYCTNLSEATVPSTMDFIGRFAFLGTKDLNIYFAAETLPANLAEDWDHGTKGYYLGVTDVVTEGDWKYATLTSGGISIIEYLGDAAELDMTAVDLGGDIVNIGGSAFEESTVEQIVLPETLQIIQAEAFAYSKLQSISIPASVTFIGREAFTYTPIETLTFAPNSQLKTIEQSAFEKTEKLEGVVIPASLTTMGRAVFKSSGIKSLTFAEGFSMTEIPEEAFAYTHLSAVTIPDSITLINHNAFREIKELKSVTLGSGEELMIMSNVFYQSGLESVHIPETVGYVGEYAFVALPNLTEFKVSENNPYYQAIDGLLVSKNGRKLIAVPAGRKGSLTVPEGIEVIGFGAFEDSKLSEISFLADANILTFGYRAFYNADGITEMHIPASVVSIDYYAFAMCDNLQSVTFAEENNLKGVYEGAFYGCKNLSDIMLPDSIVEISDFAFYGCRKLTDVPVSETTCLKGIYDYAFAYAGFAGEYTTPETLIDIGPYAFMGNKLTSITVPDTNYWDLIIGIGAFAECNELTEITLPFIGASFEDQEITWFGYIFGAGGYEANATYVPESLRKVNISEGITFIGAHAFHELELIESIYIPKTVSGIYVYAFYNVSASYSLKNEITILSEDGQQTTYVSSRDFGLGGISGSLKFSEGLEGIGPSAFSGSGLTDVVLPSTLKSISDGAFSKCAALKNVSLNDGLGEISQFAFADCTNLEKIVIPDTVKELGNSIFSGDSRLKNVVLPNDITYIPDYMFKECSSMRSIEIPETVVTIGAEAFKSCMGLESITLPSPVTEIERDAFNMCQRLKHITNLSVLELHIGSRDYGYVAAYAETITDNLGNVIFKDGTENVEYIITEDGFKFKLQDNSYTLVEYTGDEDTITLPTDIAGNAFGIYMMQGGINIIIPSGMNKIDTYAFYGSSTIESVRFADTIEEIGYYAFASCSNLADVELPNSLKIIRDGAFRDCDSLERIVIPQSVTRIEGAFDHCERLEEVIFPDTVEYFDGVLTFDGCSNLKSVVLPEGAQELRATFQACVSLESVRLPNSITRLETGAFTSCRELKTLHIPVNCNYIDQHAFQSCAKLSLTVDPENKFFTYKDGILYNKDMTKVIMASKQLTGSVSIPDGVTEISIGAFQGCTDIVEVSLPNGLTTIDNSAFAECNSLQIINLPLSLTKLGGYAFGECKNLKKVSIPSGIEIIATRAFYKCERLRTVEFSNNSKLNEISYEAFYGCSALTNFVIPETVTTLGWRALAGEGLTEITIPENVSELGGYSLGYAIVIHNQSDLVLEFGDNNIDSCRIIYEKDGTVRYRDENSDFTLINTDDGLRFVYEKGKYQLISYHGANTDVVFPTEIDGNPYKFYEVKGVVNAIFPEGIELGSYAFSDCVCLESAIIPDSVAINYRNTFNNCPTLFANSTYWENGLMYIGNHLLEVDSEVEEVVLRAETASICNGIFRNCHKLKKIELGGNHRYALSGLTNLQTLVLNEMPTEHSVSDYFGGNIPITLKGIVLTEGTIVTRAAFKGITGITIYVEANEKDVKWDENFPGWNNGNKVVYGDGWIAADFYDQNGNLMSSEIFLTHQVIRQPYLELEQGTEKSQVLVGWDIDGDGKPDTIPATSTVDIAAYPVIETRDSGYVVKFYDADGETLISKVTLPYGAIITPPAIAQKQGYITGGWIGYTEGMTVSENHSFVLDRKHIGGEHEYQAPIWVAPTCTEQGYYKHACSICGECYATDYVDALGHDFTATEHPATCTEMGTLTYTCKTCGHTYSENTPPKGHSYVGTVTKQATCTKAGEMLYMCTDCGHSVTEKTSLAAHDYQKKTSSKDWLEMLIKNISNVFFGYERDGVYYYECSQCKRIQTAEESPNGTSSGAASVQSASCFHELGDWSEYIAPTCVAEGVEARFCLVCEKPIEFKRGAEAGNHDMGEWYQTVAPTCTTEGENRRDCSSCDYFETEVVPATGHTEADAIEEKRVAPTCTEVGGYDMAVYCAVCSNELSREHVEIEALGHDMGEWYQTIAPICETEGQNRRDCSRCDHFETEVVPANGHTEGEVVVENNVASNCTETGSYDNVVYCTVCGEELSRETIVVEALGHTEADAVEENRTMPTCTEVGGYDMVIYCAVCGEELSREHFVIDALGHDMGAWYESITPTCTIEGQNRCDCSRCDHFETEFVPANGHAEADAVEENRVAPTCTEVGGYDMAVYCAVCGNELSREHVEIEALGHDMGEWCQTTAPGCETEGENRRDCSRCDHFETEVVPANGHTSADAVEENRFAPTCTEVGGYDNVVYCSVCGAELSREHVEIPAYGHAAADVVVENRVEPTCTVDGAYDNVVYCAVCHVDLSREQVILPATGHSHDAVVTAPTCTEQGYTTHTCHCGDAYVDSYVDALGHIEVIDAAFEPTCTVPGLTEGKHCSVCNEVLVVQTEIAAYGHTLSDWIVDIEPTIGVAGSKHKECMVCGETLETEVIEALTEAPTTEVPTSEPPITEPESEQGTAPETESDTDSEKSGGCNGTISASVALLAVIGCLAIGWRARKDN